MRGPLLVLVGVALLFGALWGGGYAFYHVGVQQVGGAEMGGTARVETWMALPIIVTSVVFGILGIAVTWVGLCLTMEDWT